jgi:hypothetical protein
MVKLVGDDVFKIKRIEYYDRSEGWNKAYEEYFDITRIKNILGAEAYYPVDGNVNDLSNGYDGTPYNITYTSEGLYYYAVFNGISSYFDTDLLSSFFAARNNYSICFWFKLNNNSNNNIFCTDNNGSKNENATLISVSSGYVGYHRYAGYSITIGTANAYNDDNWHFAAIIYNGTNMIINIDNGFEIVSTTDTRNVNSYHATFGRDYSGYPNYLYNGYLDEIRIYDRAITNSEIETLYKASGWAKCPAEYYNSSWK